MDKKVHNREDGGQRILVNQGSFDVLLYGLLHWMEQVDQWKELA